MTPKEKKEIAKMLRDHALLLEQKGRPIFKVQIARLRRQANRLDPHPGPFVVETPPARDTAKHKVKGVSYP